MIYSAKSKMCQMVTLQIALIINGTDPFYNTIVS